jgi:Ca2+-binding EF-hand superfamily protein
MIRAKCVIWMFAVMWLTAVGATPCRAESRDFSEYPEECQSKFKQLDPDGNRRITIEEFVVAGGAGTYAARKAAKDAFIGLDKNGDGEITIDEFCVIKELKPGEEAPTPEEECEELFKKYDTDHDGTLNLTEMVVGSNSQSFGSRKAVKDNFLLMDTNQDERLSKEEFCAGMGNAPARQE